VSELVFAPYSHDQLVRIIRQRLNRRGSGREGEKDTSGVGLSDVAVELTARKVEVSGKRGRWSFVFEKEEGVLFLLGGCVFVVVFEVVFGFRWPLSTAIVVERWTSAGRV